MVLQTMEEIKKGKREKDVQQTQLLPDNVIIQQVLPWLPIKQVTQCKSVSKEWNSRISNPNFILNHYQKSVFSLPPFSPVETLFINFGDNYYLYSCTRDDDDDDDDGNLVELEIVEGSMSDDTEKNSVYVVGSSNGLVCLAGDRRSYITLWNPSTNESRNYYPPDSESVDRSLAGIRSPEVTWGFGYASSVDDYKVVRIMMSELDGPFSSVFVFSLRTNAWKPVAFDPGEGEGEWECFFDLRPRLVNDTLYWIALASQLIEGIYYSESGSTIVAFDLNAETFHILREEVDKSSPVLCVMGGCLSKLRKTTPTAANDLVLDIVKHDSDQRGLNVVSVRLQCGLRLRDITDLIGFTKTGKIVAASNFNYYKRLFLVDPCSAKSLLTLQGQGTVYIESYVPSQISPLPLVG